MLENKMELMSRIESNLAHVLTAVDLNQAMSVIAGELDTCKIEIEHQEEVEMDMLNAYLDVAAELSCRKIAGQFCHQRRMYAVV